MSFIDNFRSFLEKAKRTLGISWQKLLDQIPDTDRLDSYRFDEVIKEWILKSQMPEAEVPILDENRNLKVETPNFHFIQGKIGDNEDKWLLVPLDFLADSVSCIFFQVFGADNTITLYYDYNVGDVVYNTENRDGLYENTAISQGPFQTDIKPYNNFSIYFQGAEGEGDYGFEYIIIFSKQKKTKISDIAYNITTWNDVTDIGASKNALRDKIVSMIAEYVALISDVAYNEATWDAVTTIAPSKNAIRDKIEAMDTLTETEILALTWVEEDIDDLGSYLENVDEDPTPELISSEAINIKPSGDIDDYLQFYTANDSPYIKAIGTDRIIIQTDDDAQIRFYIHRDGTDFMTLICDNSGHYGMLQMTGGVLYIRTSHGIRIQPSGDNDDYLEFYTSGGIPRIKVIGGNEVYLEADGNEPTIFCRYDASKYTYIKWDESAGIGKIGSTHAIGIIPSGDGSNYIMVSTTGGVPKISFVGGNGIIENVVDPTNDQDVATKKYVDDEVAGVGGGDDATNLIGSANKKWIECHYEGTYVYTEGSIGHLGHIYNILGASQDHYFKVPLAPVLGTHNLVITQIKLKLTDADASDYVTKITLYGDAVELVTDDTDRITIDTFTYDIADQTIGGNYDKVVVKVHCTCVTAFELDIANVGVECYYTS